MRATLGACRSMSFSPIYTTHSTPFNAHTVAVATPCCPAPVSAIILSYPNVAQAKFALPYYLFYAHRCDLSLPVSDKHLYCKIAQTFCQVERRWSAYIITKQIVELFLKRCIVHHVEVVIAQLFHIAMQHFGIYAPPKFP